MRNPLTTFRDSGRFLLGALALALMLLVSCLFAIAVGYSGTDRQQGTLRTSGEALGQLRAAGPKLGTVLGRNHNAHRRMSVSRRNQAASSGEPEPEGAAPPLAGEPSPQLTATDSPVVAPTSPPAPASPPLQPAPKPPPAPVPTPEPPPGPPPTPEPPPPTPEPPPPAPEPPPPSPEPPPPPQPAGEILFKATFDNGFGGWYVQSLPGRASLLTSETFEGKKAARFEVRPGDVEPDTGSQRSEVSGPTFKEGEDLYIRDAIRVPSGNTFEGPWEIIEQLHEEEWSGSPGMAVFLDSEPALRIGAGDGSPTYWNSPTLQTDRWYELIYRVNLSQDPSVGFVEVWLDGVQQELLNGQTRQYGQTMQMPETYLKAGIYRSKSSTGTSIVEHDSIVVGTSLAAVLGG